MKAVVVIRSGIFFCAFGAALCGLLIPGFYTGSLNSIPAAERMGQDAFSALLCLGMALFSLLRQSIVPKGRFIVAGGLTYVAYIQAWFSFGLVFSPLYPLYIALFGSSIFLAGREIVSLLKEDFLKPEESGFPRKSAAVVSILCVAGIGTAEILILARYLAAGGAGLNPYDVYIVLDLGLVFPAIIIASVMSLWRKRHGALLQTVALIKMATILPGLVFGDLMNFVIGGAFKDPVFCAASALISCIVLALLVKALSSIGRQS
jgi:hypothetical protein